MPQRRFRGADPQTCSVLLTAATVPCRCGRTAIGSPRRSRWGNDSSRAVLQKLVQDNVDHTAVAEHRHGVVVSVAATISASAAATRRRTRPRRRCRAVVRPSAPIPRVFGAHLFDRHVVGQPRSYSGQPIVVNVDAQTWGLGDRFGGLERPALQAADQTGYRNRANASGSRPGLLPALLREFRSAPRRPRSENGRACLTSSNCMAAVVPSFRPVRRLNRCAESRSARACPRSPRPVRAISRAARWDRCRPMPISPAQDRPRSEGHGVPQALEDENRFRHRSTGNAHRLARSGNVRYRQAELARAFYQLLHGGAEVADASQRVEQVVHPSASSSRLRRRVSGADAVQPDQRVRLIDFQIDVEERIAVAGVDRGLVAMVQADRNLRAQPVGRRTGPRPQPTRDGGEQNVIDGRRGRADAARWP